VNQEEHRKIRTVALKQSGKPAEAFSLINAEESVDMALIWNTANNTLRNSILMADRLAGILLLQYVVLAVAYGVQGNWPKMIYWIGAVILLTGVVLMK